jgi:hypothetical protein
VLIAHFTNAMGQSGFLNLNTAIELMADIQNKWGVL